MFLKTGLAKTQRIKTYIAYLPYEADDKDNKRLLGLAAQIIL